MKNILALVAISAVGTNYASAHSWIEQMQVISSNGSFMGNYGYPRGYVARTDPGFNGHSDMYMLPSLESGRLRINASDLLCHPAQRTANYSAAYPQLSASPGDWIAMKYLENGHVTQPWVQAGKPSGAGTVFVFGTYDPDPEQTIVDVLQWTRNGTGGNGKGWLIAAQNFDDRRCHQISDSAISLFRQQSNPDRVANQPTSQVEQWCETDLQLPTNIKGSSLTAYWIWQWPTAIGTIGAPEGKDEYYTTCMDFAIQGELASQAVNAGEGSSPSPKYGLGQQDPQSTAVSDYASRTAFTTSPIVYTAGQVLVAAKARLAATPTISTIYSLPGATFTTTSSTYVLEPQGTALQINGQLAAYVNCDHAVTTGSISPTCPGSSPAETTAGTTATPVAPADASISSTSVPAPATVTVTSFATTTIMGSPAVRATSFITVYATVQPIAIVLEEGAGGTDLASVTIPTSQSSASSTVSSQTTSVLARRMRIK